jgi:hypothetical protein
VLRIPLLTLAACIPVTAYLLGDAAMSPLLGFTEASMVPLGLAGLGILFAWRTSWKLSSTLTSMKTDIAHIKKHCKHCAACDDPQTADDPVGEE